MKLYIDPISLTALLLLAVLLGFVTWDHVKPAPEPKETILKNVDTVGRETYWVCRGGEPELWACRQVSQP